MSIPTFTFYLTDPKQWGPSWWLFLHGIAIISPDYFHGQKAKDLLIAMTTLIPCIECRKHHETYRETVSPLSDYWLATATRVAMWLNNAHNSVNLRNALAASSTTRTKNKKGLRQRAVWNWKRHKRWSQKNITNDTWIRACLTVLLFAFCHQRLVREDCRLTMDFIRLLCTLIKSSEFSRVLYQTFNQDNTNCKHYNTTDLQTMVLAIGKKFIESKLEYEMMKDHVAAIIEMK